MKREINFLQLAGFCFVSLLGTILHFLYDWTDSVFTTPFASVNESTWEHMKLLFFPLFLFAIVENFIIGKNCKNFWCIKLKGTLLGLLVIPVLFYTLRGIFGTTPDWINILIFFIAVAAAFLYETNQFKINNKPCKYTKTAIIALSIIAMAFIFFTFIPPKIPLFEDPINGSFGIYKKALH